MLGTSEITNAQINNYFTDEVTLRRYAISRENDVVNDNVIPLLEFINEEDQRFGKCLSGSEDKSS